VAHWGHEKHRPEINRRLSRIRAAKVETDGNADSTTISLSCLKADFDDVFKVFTDVLKEPEFRERQA